MVMVVKPGQAYGRRLAVRQCRVLSLADAREKQKRAIRRNSDDVRCGEPPARGSGGGDVGAATARRLVEGEW